MNIMNNYKYNKSNVFIKIPLRIYLTTNMCLTDVFNEYENICLPDKYVYLIGGRKKILLEMIFDILTL